MSVSNHVSDIMNKDDHAKLSSESKQIFSLLLSYFEGFLRKKDNQVNELKDRIFLSWTKSFYNVEKDW